MKSHTKRALRAMPATQVQISMPVQGVLRDCQGQSNFPQRGNSNFPTRLRTIVVL